MVTLCNPGGRARPARADRWNQCIPYDPITLRLVRNELDPTHAVPPHCVFVPPVIG